MFFEFIDMIDDMCNITRDVCIGLGAKEKQISHDKKLIKDAKTEHQLSLAAAKIRADAKAIAIYRCNNETEIIKKMKMESRIYDGIYDFSDLD